MMKKVLISVSVILITIIVLLTLVIKVYITPDRIKAFLIPSIETSIGRQVDMDKIDIGLFKGIQIKDFIVKEIDKTSIFLRCKDFVLKFQLLPLLSKKILIDELRLISPEITIYRDLQGRYNFEDMGKKESDAAKKEDQIKRTDELPVSLLISNVSVKNARFSFMDRKKEFYDLKGGISFAMKMQSADKIKINSSGTMDVHFEEVIRWKPIKNHIKDIDFGLEYDVLVNPQSKEIVISNADLHIRNISSSIKGKAKNLTSSPEIDLSISLPGVNSSEALSIISGVIDVKGIDLSGTVSADLKISGRPEKFDSLTTKGTVTLKEVGMKYKKINTLFNGNIDFSSAGDNISISNSSLSLSGIHTRIKGDIRTIKSRPDLDMHIVMSKASTSEIQKLISPLVDFKGLELSGFISTDLKINGVPQEPASIKSVASFGLDNLGVKYQGTDILIDGDINLKTASDSLFIKKADITVQDIAASIIGDIKNLKASPYINLNVVLPKTKSQSLQSAITPFANLKGLSLSGSLAANMKVKGRPKQPESLKATGNISLDNVGVKYENLDARLNGTLKFRDDLMNFNLQTSSKNSTATVSGSIKSYFKNQDINLDLYSKSMNIDELISSKPVQGSTPSKKPGKDPSKQAPKEAEPLKSTLSATGGVKIDTAIYKEMKISNLDMKYKFKNNQLNISQFTADTAEGRLALNGVIDFSKPGYQYNISTSIDAIKASKLLNSFYPKARDTIFGAITSDLKFKGSGTTTKNINKNLSADGSFNINDGKLTNIGIADSLSLLLNVNELRTITINRASGTVKIRDGVARLESIFTSDDLEMNPSGVIGLDGNLDLAFDLRLSPHLTGKAMSSSIAKHISDDKGWGIIPIICPGTFSKPKCAPDLAKTGQRILEKEIDKVFDKLFKKDQDQAPQESGQEQKPAAEDPLKELFKQLF